ncbi:MAG: MFS transporter [Alphaproteobacteria bacterium]|nr:MFS transporter [Alphaproteobacteria bacterium]
MPDAREGLTGGIGSASRPAESIEARASWVAATVTLAVLSISYGSPLLIVVGLKPITADLATQRSVVALAASLTWLGTGAGGMLMGWVADRIGVRWTVIFGAVNIALGLAVSASGSVWALYFGHAVLLGFLGNGALYPPLVIYVSRWFDRRRGTALALISSGQYVAGVVWPTVFELAISRYGWRVTMVGFAVTVAIAIPPVAALFLRPVPVAATANPGLGGSRRREVLGLPPNVVLAILCAAGFCCCVPMSVPQGHLVAFCSDLGIPAAQGAAMLSVLQGCAFVSRQFWGWLADRIGGLRTVLAGSACQAVAIAAFLLTQDEFGLFAVAAAFGLGFSGIIPAYVVVIRELFPSSEAAWRVPAVLFVSMGGMAFGGWFAGALYDRFGFYAPAFATGVLFNLANLALIGFLVMRQRWGARLLPLPAQ